MLTKRELIGGGDSYQWLGALNGLCRGFSTTGSAATDAAPILVRQTYKTD